MHEMVFSVRTTSRRNDPRNFKQNNNDYEDCEYINQEELQKLRKEIDMLQDIEEDKDTIKYCIKEEEATGGPEHV